MLKYILLGFLLVPCLSNAMENSRTLIIHGIEKVRTQIIEGKNKTTYLKGNMTATRELTHGGWIYYATIDCSPGVSWILTDQGSAKWFHKLEEDYDNQNQ
jgi:hypothetical protein